MMLWRKLFLVLMCGICLSGFAQALRPDAEPVDSMQLRFQQNTHPVQLDSEGKIIPWYKPQQMAYDQFIRQRWNFIKTSVPNAPGPSPRSGYPAYYFYCAFRPVDGQLEPDTWMNDVGEKIPNWFESAHLYYAYTGDTSVMSIVEKLADYTLDHGMSPADFAWPRFPYTATNAGDTEFKGFTSAGRFVLHEIQVDHAAEMGLTYYRLYQYSNKAKFKEAALRIANTLVTRVRNGSLTQSPWPYRVVMADGKVTAEYGANWTGAYMLFDHLIAAGEGSTPEYVRVQKIVKEFLLRYPMKTGYWADGHSDTPVNSSTYKSNLSASNFTLFLLDNPVFDPDWKAHVPALIKWTEENFVDRGTGGEPGQMWGANVVGEQDDFLVKMDYQTARYAAECARWYAISGDATYKEKAYRSLNWVTYCSNENGMAFESPLSKGVSNWWSDCYGEGPRMFYHTFAAIPEWAPQNQNHILYSAGVLREVRYSDTQISYTPTVASDTEFLKVSFLPKTVLVNGTPVGKPSGSNQGYTARRLTDGNYAVTIYRTTKGTVQIIK